MFAIVYEKSCLLVEDRNVVVVHENVVLVVWGEKCECLQKMLPREKIVGYRSVAVDIAKVEGDLELFLCEADWIHLIYIQLGTLGLTD